MRLNARDTTCALLKRRKLVSIAERLASAARLRTGAVDRDGVLSHQESLNRRPSGESAARGVGRRRCPSTAERERRDVVIRSLKHTPPKDPYVDHKIVGEGESSYLMLPIYVFGATCGGIHISHLSNQLVAICQYLSLMFSIRGLRIVQRYACGIESQPLPIRAVIII